MIYKTVHNKVVSDSQCPNSNPTNITPLFINVLSFPLYPQACHLSRQNKFTLSCLLQHTLKHKIAHALIIPFVVRVFAGTDGMVHACWLSEVAQTGWLSVNLHPLFYKRVCWTLTPA